MLSPLKEWAGLSPGGVAFPASAPTWKEAGGFLPWGMVEVCGLFTCGRTWRAVGMFTEAGRGLKWMGLMSFWLFFQI